MIAQSEIQSPMVMSHAQGSWDWLPARASEAAETSHRDMASTKHGPASMTARLTAWRVMDVT